MVSKLMSTMFIRQFLLFVGRVAYGKPTEAANQVQSCAPGVLSGPKAG